MWSQELPWNPFVSKPAPPDGIVFHYHAFLTGKRDREKKRETDRHTDKEMGVLFDTKLCYSSYTLKS